ncbi:MAG: AraC family transcriptional regulator ligand-binding domain-containing protein [Stenotrophobium sp.]
MAQQIKKARILFLEPYARSLVDYLRGLGLAPVSLYSAERVASIESIRAHVAPPFDEWISMVEQAIDATGDRDLALKVGDNLKPQHLGVLGFIVMSCDTVEEAEMQVQRYGRLAGERDLYKLVHKGSKMELHLTWRYGLTAPPIMEQLTLAARMRASRWITQRSDLCWDAYFQMKRPADVRSYTRVFGGKVHFGQPCTKLVAPLSDIQMPLPMANRETREFVARQAEALLKELGDQPEFVRQLSTVLGNGLSMGHVSLKHAAAALQCSTRTLRRRLADCDCSFQQVLDQVRRSTAERYLREPNASLADVAFMLGYSEQSTFQQAFKRWSGITPGKFRAGASGPKRKQALRAASRKSVIRG